jgi:hypothetical protein
LEISSDTSFDRFQIWVASGLADQPRLQLPHGDLVSARLSWRPPRDGGHRLDRFDGGRPFAARDWLIIVAVEFGKTEDDLAFIADIGLQLIDDPVVDDQRRCDPPHAARRRQVAQHDLARLELPQRRIEGRGATRRRDCWSPSRRTADETRLQLPHGDLVIGGRRPKVAINVERHLDGRVAHQALHPLGAEALLDE